MILGRPYAVIPAASNENDVVLDEYEDSEINCQCNLSKYLVFLLWIFEIILYLLMQMQFFMDCVFHFLKWIRA